LVNHGIEGLGERGNHRVRGGKGEKRKKKNRPPHGDIYRGHAVFVARRGEEGNPKTNRKKRGKERGRCCSTFVPQSAEVGEKKRERGNSRGRGRGKGGKKKKKESGPEFLCVPSDLGLKGPRGEEERKTGMSKERKKKKRKKVDEHPFLVYSIGSSGREMWKRKKKRGQGCVEGERGKKGVVPRLNASLCQKRAVRGKQNTSGGEEKKREKKEKNEPGPSTYFSSLSPSE